MKKVVALVLTVVLFILGTVACAEEVDLKSMSNEQLSALYAAVEQEMTERDLLKTHLFVGEYIVGEDIAPGRYVVSVVDAYDSIIGVYIQYDILEYNEEEGKWKKVFVDDSLKVGQKGTFTLKEGQKFAVHNGEFEVVSYKP